MYKHVRTRACKYRSVSPSVISSAKLKREEVRFSVSAGDGHCRFCIFCGNSDLLLGSPLKMPAIQQQIRVILTYFSVKSSRKKVSVVPSSFVSDVRALIVGRPGCESAYKNSNANIHSCRTITSCHFLFNASFIEVFG